MYAGRINNLVESPVREILKVIDQPGMISFAGGLPAKECFPKLDYTALDSSHLQYGASEGDWNLREQVADLLRARGLNVTAAQVLILSGSQQGIDLVAKLFIEPGVKVAVEVPTYLAALQAFDLLGAQYCAYTGKRSDMSGTRLTYVVPTFQNPTGICYSQAQRKQLASDCDATGSVLFEDDPYRDLMYNECDRTPVCSYIKQSEWVYQSSFSKCCAPGLRLGYLVCSEALLPYLVRLKQAADLHSCRLSQQLVFNWLDAKQQSALAAFYRQRRDQFQQVLVQEFSDLADWQLPDGGLFFWLQLKQQYSVDTRLLLNEAIANGVAFMPGEAFYPTGFTPGSAIRLNFSHASAASARQGLRTLAGIFSRAV